jgi:streptogramin lyase
MRTISTLSAALIVCSALALARQPPTIIEYPVPTAFSAPYIIAPGPDGALWFTENGGGKIGRITTVGAVSEYIIPTANNPPRALPSPKVNFYVATRRQPGRECIW